MFTIVLCAIDFGSVETDAFVKRRGVHELSSVHPYANKTNRNVLLNIDCLREDSRFDIFD